MPVCEYFTRYGNDRVPGECGADATLELIDNVTPPILVCGDHAARIVERFPSLGGRERFANIGDGARSQARWDAALARDWAPVVKVPR
jgi:hypothetical protein